MRVLVMFDLPSLSNEEKREYRTFRKHLITKGFLMLQESIYCKLALNQSEAAYIVDNIKRHKPKSGLAQILCITEKQYSKMEMIVGEANTEIINSDERLIIL
ncbi:MAG: CRISPR-associated endonuclease Cas2 [Clostridium sp.]